MQTAATLYIGGGAGIFWGDAKDIYPYFPDKLVCGKFSSYQFSAAGGYSSVLAMKFF